MEISKQLEAIEIWKLNKYSTSRGRIYSQKGKELYLYSLPSKYIQCRIRHKNKLMIIYKHILIYLATKGVYNPKLVIAHLDGDNTNNSPENLSAITQSENVKMQPKRGKYTITRFSAIEIEQIKSFKNQGLNCSQISKRLGAKRLSVAYHFKKS